MPRKPTDTFGGWIFATDGTVSHESDKLPDDKESQEKLVIEMFIKRFNDSQPTKIDPTYIDLEESDHDFEITTDGKKVTVQITEIVERDYVISKGATRTEGAKEDVFRIKFGAQGSQEVDITKRNRALQAAVERKINKHYSKPRNEFWLLVFTTDAGFYPEDADAELEELLSPVEYAQEYLKSVDSVFDKVWFLGLFKDTPLMVWDNSLSR